MRDAVLQGPEADEIEALVAIVTRRARPGLLMALRLRAKGWIDVANGAYLVTLSGRTLLDRAMREPFPA